MVTQKRLQKDKVVVILNYRQAVDYIEQIPKFTEKHPLEHTKEMLRRLGNPQNHFRVIHVAGTNGKGSVCAYLASMLKQGGYRTGLFTSPHLVTINERFQINGEMISDQQFLKTFLHVKEVIDQAVSEGIGHPSYFETLFLMGMEIFREAQVDYLVLETGLGGRLDATNSVEKPLACIITSISLDHMEYLGNTVSEIAGEKAGIIKPGVPVIYDGHVEEVAQVIEAQAKKMGSPAYALTADQYELVQQNREGIIFRFRGEELQIPYIAAYQMMYASLAYFTMKTLQELHGIPDHKLREGIRQVNWPGRMETILPGVIVDGAHNEDGISQFVKTVRHFRKDNRIVLLFSAVSDKQYQEMIELLCREITPDAVVTTQIGGYREIPAQELARLFEENGVQEVAAEPEVSKALEKALSFQQDGMVFCVGSLYLIGEIKVSLKEEKKC